MDAAFQSFLSLLHTLRDELSHLSELARQKNAAVCGDDLTALDKVMRQEQAAALRFRGLEQKREELLSSLGLNGVPLAAVPDRFPAAMRADAVSAVRELQDQYRIYQANAEVARNTLECNLHEVEQVLAALGKETPPPQSSGYTAAEAEPPQSMKTDFRA